MKGKLITFEGCEGAGKSTQINFLKEYCAEHKIDAVFTREPGGTPIAEKIRQVILDAENKEMDALAELLLYAAARAQHVAELIVPALNAGKLVVCDRFTDSTVAYQGYARGFDTARIEALNTLALNGIAVDLTVFLDVPPDAGFIRKGGADAGDRLENESLDFHRRVYKGYQSQINAQPERFLVIASAALKKEETFQRIVEGLKKRGIV